MEVRVFRRVSREGGEAFSMAAVFAERSLELTVLQGPSALKSTVGSEEIERLSKLHKLAYDSYFGRLKQYVVEPPADVSISLEGDQIVVYRLLENGLKVRYFFSTLEQVNYTECIDGMLQGYHLENARLSQKLSKCKAENNENYLRRTECEQKLQEFVGRKKADDMDTLGKFVLVLNEKKRKIQHLAELLDAFKAGRPTSNPTVEVKGRRRKKDALKRPERVSESEESSSDVANSSHYNTDEEDDKKDVVAEKTESKPSTSRLLQDSPPRDFLVARRVRSGNQGAHIQGSVQENRVNSSEEQKGTNKQEEELKKESPVVDFNTQDLLEML